MKPCLFLLTALLLAQPGSAAPAQSPGRPDGPQPRDRFGGPQPGDPAPSFALSTLEGKEIRLGDLRGKPVVLILGSYTCPIFRGKTGATEKLVRSYGDRASFLYLYTVEAHPCSGDSAYRPGKPEILQPNRREGILVAQPATIDERNTVAGECVQKLALTAPLLVDGMDNAVWKAYGSAPNAAYLIDAAGKVVLRQGWFDPPAFETALQHFLEKAP